MSIKQLSSAKSRFHLDENNPLEQKVRRLQALMRVMKVVGILILVFSLVWMILGSVSVAHKGSTCKGTKAWFGILIFFDLVILSLFVCMKVPTVPDTRDSLTE